MASQNYHSSNHSLKLSKELKYEANVRNGLYMWHYKCSMNTVQNINLVKQGKIFVPRFEEVKLRPCPKPPLKKFVILEVLKELEIKKQESRVNFNQFANPNQEFSFHLPITENNPQTCSGYSTYFQL